MNLAAQQASLGADISIASECEIDTERSREFWSKRIPNADRVKLIALRDVRRTHLLSGQSASHLHATSDILHLHGVWDALIWSCLAPPRGRRARVILAPHGMLSAWSMSQKRLKKQIIWRAALRRAMRNVDCLHALNDAEVRELQCVLPQTPMRILPNGINAEEFAHAGDAPQERLTGPHKRYVLALARLHPMKGLDRLVDAFAAAVRMDASMSDVGLVIAGPDCGILHLLRSRAQALGIAARVSFPGPVFGQEKISLLAGALCVCQPSRHEGFSVTLLEALASGTPTIATPEANFPESAIEGCGKVVDAHASQLARAIIELANDGALRARMGSIGKRFVQKRYCWKAIAAESLCFYRDVGAQTAVAGSTVFSLAAGPSGLERSIVENDSSVT